MTAKRPTRMHRLLLLAVILAGTVGCDQASKVLAVNELKGEPTESYLGGTVRIGYTENPGAFLSLFGNLSEEVRFWILTAAVGLLLFGMLAYTVASSMLDRLQTAAFGLSIGGGLSNWLDRLFNDGRVVDYVSLGIGPVRTGVFNVADVAIMAGLALLFWSARKRPEPKEPEPVASE